MINIFYRYKTIPVLTVVGLSLLILGFHSAYYFPFLSDDSLISLRYSQRLLNGEGLTWTEGRPVEGYSNLLWVLLIAGFGLLNIDLINASRILGFISMSIVVLSISYWYAYKERSSIITTTIGLMFFCLSAPIAVWTIGGLEQPLYAALISLVIPLLFLFIESEKPENTNAIILSTLLGLMSITRPDGFLFFVVVILSIYISRYLLKKKILDRKTSMLLMFPFAILFFGQIIFRVVYYGEFIPNTALVKISPSLMHFAYGVYYVINGLFSLAPFSVFSIIIIAIFLYLPHKRNIGIPLFLITSAWISYVAFIGGDIFPAYRHFVPLIVVFVFCIIEGTDWFMSKYANLFLLKQRVMYPVMFLVMFVYIQFTDANNKLAISERWEWDGKVVGNLLKQTFKQQNPLVAVTAAGCIPYWSELPSIDMLGLNDYHIPRNKPKDFGRGLLGHELGDPSYILQRNPDIIVFWTGTIKSSFSEIKKLHDMGEFKTKYTPVNFFGTDPYNYSFVMWINKYSEKIGISKTTSQIKIPSYLLNGNEKTVAYINADGKPVISIDSMNYASITINSIEANKDWHVNVISNNSQEIESGVILESNEIKVTLSTKSKKPIEIEEVLLNVKT